MGQRRKTGSDGCCEPASGCASAHKRTVRAQKRADTKPLYHAEGCTRLSGKRIGDNFHVARASREHDGLCGVGNHYHGRDAWRNHVLADTDHCGDDGAIALAAVCHGPPNMIVSRPLNVIA
jgi:hypothetical protein